MTEAQKGNAYKSPLRKLVRFFEKSRNQWKAKCREAKEMVKRLENRVRFLETSKARLKDRVKALEAEVARMKAEGQAREEVGAAQKETAEESIALERIEEFHLVPAHHVYSLGHIVLFVSLVLSASASFRCASRAIEIVFSLFQLQLPSPSWSTGRLWLLRLGYYKLTRPKDRAEDWVWIVDHTVQLGREKCLIILGVRLCCLPSPGKYLSQGGSGLAAIGRSHTENGHTKRDHRRSWNRFKIRG